jgi:hypothetical protein
MPVAGLMARFGVSVGWLAAKEAFAPTAPGAGVSLWDRPASGPEAEVLRDAGGAARLSDPNAPNPTAAEKRKLALTLVAVGVVVCSLVAALMLKLAFSR